ncbi:hypothetical protein V7S43_014102 [Phytophthora oleae]|uniref:Pre-rRNA-processing protein RIX1 N-terminal domain-containing protein n=1 Tax=Phytophthora oleae TaxID=2107226 RepID=A0ABD3F5E2_9STRA
MCLLVFKTVLGSSAARREDICTLLTILTPTIVAALAQLTSRPAISNEPSAGKISAACLETSLYLLAKVASVIEEDECDALTKSFERLLVPSSAPDFNVRPAVLSVCFDAIHQILVHSSVAEIMGPRLTKLLQVGDLKVPYVQYTSRQVYSGKNSSHCACQLCDEDDKGTEKTTLAASLLSGIGLDATRDSVKFAVQGPDEIRDGVSVPRPDAPQWFDEEDSEDDTNEMESGDSSLLQSVADDPSTSQIACIASTTDIPHWFDDSDDEEESGIELPTVFTGEQLSPTAQLESRDCSVDGASRSLLVRASTNKDSKPLLRSPAPLLT